MTITIQGTASGKLEIFGHTFWADSVHVDHSFAVPPADERVPLPLGFDVDVSESGTGAEVKLEWNGLSLVDDQIALGGSKTINVGLDSGNGFDGTVSVSA